MCIRDRSYISPMSIILNPFPYLCTMTDFLSKEYWEERYATGETAWDMGIVSPPLKAYFDQLTNKDLSILIPVSYTHLTQPTSDLV